MKTLLKGGTVVSSKESRIADVLIEDEKILEVAENIDAPDAETVDVTGKLLFPGFIDAHTHFGLHVAGTVTADGYRSGTKAALIGGTTTVVDHGTQYHGESLMEAMHNWEEKAAEGASCDYGFHMSISEWKDDLEDQVQEMIDNGITSFKVYMTYPGMILNDEELYKILKVLWEKKCFAGSHCENAGVIDALIAEAKAKGDLAPAAHYRTRPAEMEAEAVHRLMVIADAAKAPVMVVHTTCEEALEEIRWARKRGQTVFSETCPQYLLLDHSALDQEDFFESSKYICAPPLRTKKDQDALWDAIAGGEIQTIATDHCSFTTEQKKMGKDDFTKIPGGVPGAEHRGVLIYTYGVAAGRITKEKMCEVMSENVAKLYGLYPRKGVIAPGSDADIVVLDPEAKGVASAATQHYDMDYCPYEGMELACAIDQVYLRGVLAVKDNECIREGMGEYLKRDLMMLPAGMEK